MIWVGPRVCAVLANLANVRYFLNFSFYLRKVFSIKFNAPSESVDPLIHNFAEGFYRNFLEDLPNRGNHLSDTRELFAFQLPLQVTEQKEVAQCDVG
jgi:hypothetical protein